MPTEKSSLLGGRNSAPLTPADVHRALNTFLGLDNTVSVIHVAGARTVFRVGEDESGVQYGEVVFGSDIYPGSSVVDANSALSLDAAAAHELTHYYRWKDKRALSDERLHHIDEALTSLQAITRYDKKLCETDIRLLVADAVQRLQLFVNEQAVTEFNDGK